MAKKSKNIKIRVISLAIIIILIWAVLPIIAGACKLGEPDGPKIYPIEMHKTFYGVGYSAFGHGTPRKSFKSYFYTRPWFYFMKTTPIPKAEAENMINSVKQWVHNIDE